VFARLTKWIMWIVAGPERTARHLGVRIGRNCRILCTPECFGSEPWLVTIGDDVTVAAGVRFLTHDGSGWLIKDENGRRFRYRPIQIGSRVFVGIGAVLLPGVVLGNRVIVGAGSVVTKSVPDGMLVAGNPARCVGEFADFEKQALAQWVTAEGRAGKGFQEWVNSVVDPSPRPWVDGGSAKRIS